MTAPALILLAPGSGESHACEAMHRLRKRLQMSRPDLDVSLAFLDTCPPTGPQVLSVLSARGVSEVVFVPLNLTNVVDLPEAVVDLADRAAKSHPQISFSTARPIGPAVELLNVLDDTLRQALHASHCSEVDALVLSAPTTGDVRGSALLARRARQWASHHHVPVHVATSDGHGVSVAHAVTALRATGRRHIAIASLWLAPDEAWQEQRREALALGAATVSAPFADHQLVSELILARYAFAAMSLLSDEQLGLTEAELPEAVGR